MILSIAQARMSSTRLPGKVLLPIRRKTILEWVVEALPEPQLVATSTDDSDRPIGIWCKEHNIKVFGGPLDDVLKRFYLAVQTVPKTDWILRVCCDCPMLTKEIVEKFINYFNGWRGDSLPYTIFTNRPYDPDGYDMELFSVEALKMAHEYATDPRDREHVTPWFYRHLNVRRFSVFGREPQPEDLSEKCSIDTIEDYEKVKKIMEGR